MTNQRDEFHIIHRYTRAQAIADGVLVDLMQHPTAERPDLDDLRALVHEAGFRYPIAMTATAFAAAVHPLDGSKLPEGQDTHGRLWDVLWLLRCAIRRSGGGHCVHFTVQVYNARHHQPVDLKAVCGPGDDGEPVLTIMLPLMESSA